MGGVGGGVITLCGVRWIQSCGNLEDVASLTICYVVSIVVALAPSSCFKKPLWT